MERKRSIRSARREERVRQVLERRQPDLTVVIENVHDPHNVSAVLRTADAVGIAQVHLIYTVEQFPKLGRKSSASARKWIEIRKFKSVRDCYRTLHEEGFTIFASRLDCEARSLYDLDLVKKTALVFGNEHRGVSDEAAECADGIFYIPMMGMVRSLNISVACAVALYEAYRQRSASSAYAVPKFPSSVLEEMVRSWLKK